MMTMTTTTLAATMETAHGDVVLEEVGIDAAIDGLLAVVSAQQRYRNPAPRTSRRYTPSRCRWRRRCCSSRWNSATGGWPAR